MNSGASSCKKFKNPESGIPASILDLYVGVVTGGELGEPRCYYDLIRLSSEMAEYISTSIAGEYLYLYNRGEWSSDSLGGAILDYIYEKTERNAYEIIKAASSGSRRGNNPLVSGVFGVLAESCSGAAGLPDFVDKRGKTSDLFLYFFRLEEELDTGGFVHSDPGVKIFNGYLALIEFLLSALSPIFKNGLRRECEAVLNPNSPESAEILKKLKSEIPSRSVSLPSPIASLKDFTAFHGKYFTGRNLIISEIEKFISNGSGVYGLITGGPGIGKTALLCNFADSKKNIQPISHFVRRINSLDSPSVILRSLLGQALKMSGEGETAISRIPHDIKTLREQFPLKLEEAARIQKKKGKKILLLIDGIDDAENPESILRILPPDLPSNVCGLISARNGDSESSAANILNIRTFENCPLSGFNEDETKKYLENSGTISTRTSIPENFYNNIQLASSGGIPLKLRQISEAVKSGLINIDDFSGINIDSGNPAFDHYFLSKIFFPLSIAPGRWGSGEVYVAGEILGLLLQMNHSIDDRGLAEIFKTDLYRIKRSRRILNRFILIEDGKFSVRRNEIPENLSEIYSKKDLIRYHRMIIDYYEHGSGSSGVKPDFRSFSYEALRCLPLHYHALGKITGDYQALWNLAADDDFRLEQSLRPGVPAILKTLSLALDSAVDAGNIYAVLEFGFLFNDIESGGIKGGLSMIVFQAIAGNYAEALNLTRRVPDDSFQYKQMLFLAWLLAKNGDYLKCMEMLEEALMLPGASFCEEEENFIFGIVEAVIGLGISEGLDVLKTGVDESRMVRYYSRLAGLLKNHPDLILKLATGVSMQLRKIGDEEVKGLFISEFAGIITGLDDEIKKRQFLENLVFEAKNLDSEKIRFTAISDLACVYSRIDGQRTGDLIKDSLRDLEDMGAAPLRFGIEAMIAGKIAQIGQQEWACSEFDRIINSASNLMIASERAEVYGKIAGSTVSLEPGKRADFLERIFSLSDGLENILQQVAVMAGIAGVLGTSDEDAELLNIYTAIFENIPELPVDRAASLIAGIGENIRVVREKYDYVRIITSIKQVLSGRATPGEKISVITSTVCGIADSANIDGKTGEAFIKEILEFLPANSGIETEKEAALSLGKMAECIAFGRTPESEDLLRIIVRHARNLGDSGARSLAYAKIGATIGKIRNHNTITAVFEYLDAVISEETKPDKKADALAGLAGGISGIPDGRLRSGLNDRLVKIAENLQDGNQAYRVLLAATGGLMSNGEDEGAIELYKKALSLIPLEEEQAPDAPGGVMAGLCRGLAPFGGEEWAMEICSRMAERLDFVVPQKKRLEALEGIIDGLSTLEDKDILDNYYRKFIETVENFTERGEKAAGFRLLADAFDSTGAVSSSRGMWERLVSITAALDEVNSGDIKARYLAEAVVSIWKFSDKDWVNQAFGMILNAAAELSSRYFPVYLENLFGSIGHVGDGESAEKIVDRTMALVESIENPDLQLECIQGICRGIDSLSKGRLLNGILERLVKSVKLFRRGTCRVQAMAAISRNFLNIGIKTWPQKAFEQIEQACASVKDSKTRATLLGEMAKIPLFSGDREWQNSVVAPILDREIGKFSGENASIILKSIAGAISLAQDQIWSRRQIDKIIKISGKVDKCYVPGIYEELFKGFSKSGDVEGILLYRRGAGGEVLEKSASYLSDAIKILAQTDLKKAIKYFGSIGDDQVRSSVSGVLFAAMLDHEKDFKEDEFNGKYREFLRLAVYDRGSLDFTLGNVISRRSDMEMLRLVADFLGLIDLETPAEEIPYEIEPPQEEIKIKTEKAETKKPPEPSSMNLPAIFEVSDSALSLYMDYLKVEEERYVGPKDVVLTLDLKVLKPFRRRGKKFQQKLAHSRTVKPPDFSDEPESPESKEDPKNETVKERESPKKEEVLDDSSEISDFLKEGYKYIRERRIAKASDVFQQACDKYPEDPRGLIGLAVASYFQQDYRKAAGYYVNSIKIKSEFDVLERFLRAVPRNNYVLYDFANHLFQLGEKAETIKLCEHIKSDGIYFDFAKKVDELRDKCAGTPKWRIISFIRDNMSYAFLFAGFLFFLYIAICAISPTSYRMGKSEMAEAFNDAQNLLSYDKEKRRRKASVTYNEYTILFLNAADQLSNVKKSIFFDETRHRQAVLDEAECRYQIGHSLIMWNFIPFADRLKPSEIENAFSARDEVIKKLGNLLAEDPDNYRAYYLIGRCYLDFALDDDAIRKLSGTDRQRCFEKAIYNLDSAIAGGSGYTGSEQYLALASARVEYFLAYPEAYDFDSMKKALKELDIAEAMQPNPRITVYRIAVFAMLNDMKDARVAYNDAIAGVTKEFANRPKTMDYWLAKIRYFADEVSRSGSILSPQKRKNIDGQNPSLP